MPSQPGHHNNKAKKIVSGPHKRCNSSHRSYHRHPHTVRYPAHRLKSLAVKPAKPTSPLASPQNSGVIAPQSTSRPARTMLELPAALERPPLKEINVQDLYKSCPELKDTPPPYVREKLRTLAPAMLIGIQSATILTSRSQLPHEIQVNMSDPMAEPSVAPTHILALSSSRPPRNTSPKQVTLYAIHSMVFAANCNSFPLLPFSPASTREGNKTNTVTLPVVHFALPAPDSFIILSTYIYTKSANYLRYELFPPNWASDVQSVVKKALFIHGLWANARAFGVVDTAFWEVIDECWRKVIRALSELTDWKPSA